MTTLTSPSKILDEPYPYPSCWQDDARVQVLLAPFRDRSVNTESYDSKIKFWQDTIHEYCLIKGKANFSKHDLQRTFTKGQRVPCCFDTVLAEMQRKKLIRLRKDYEYDPENSWSGWMVNSFVKKPLSWGIDQIKLKLGGQDGKHLAMVEFIHLEVINKYCSDLQQLLYNNPYVGKLYHYDALKTELCASLNFTEETLCLCFQVLNMKRKIGLEYKNDGNKILIHLVKIPSKEDDDIAINEADHAVHNLQVTKASLEKQLEEIEFEIKENENKAREYIKENKRLLAKSFLRKKHLLEKNHERRSLALHNIETLLSNVIEAKLNGVILDAYKFGSKALQNALDVSSLKYDNVDEIVSDVRETLDNYREVQNSLAKSNLNDSLDDEDELERELRDIMGDSNTNTPIKNQKDNNNASMPIKVEITDADLLEMLNGLEIEQRTPGKDASNNTLYSKKAEAD